MDQNINHAHGDGGDTDGASRLWNGPPSSFPSGSCYGCGRQAGLRDDLLGACTSQSYTLGLDQAKPPFRPPGRPETNSAGANSRARGQIRVLSSMPPALEMRWADPDKSEPDSFGFSSDRPGHSDLAFALHNRGRRHWAGWRLSFALATEDGL